MKAGTFAPDLTAFRDLIKTLDEGLIGLFEILLSFAASMLKLYQSGPETTSCIVDLERGINQLLGLSKETIPELQHYCFKVDLPF